MACKACLAPTMYIYSMWIAGTPVSAGAFSGERRVGLTQVKVCNSAASLCVFCRFLLLKFDVRFLFSQEKLGLLKLGFQHDKKWTFPQLPWKTSGCWFVPNHEVLYTNRFATRLSDLVFAKCRKNSNRNAFFFFLKPRQTYRWKVITLLLWTLFLF